MNKIKLFTIFTLPIMWLIYFLFELFSGNIVTFQSAFFCILIDILLLVLGTYIYKLSNSFKDGFKKKNVVHLIFVFLFIDQGIKFIINLFFFNDKVEIIPSLLAFHPIINTSGSWLNVRFNTNISFSLLIFFNIISILLFIEIYRYYNSCNNDSNFWIDSCFIFIITGAICSAIDKIFYGGSLDFIGISSLFIADIKDIYINLGIFFFVISCYKGGFFTDSNESTLKDDFKEVKKFMKFILKDLKFIK